LSRALFLKHGAFQLIIGHDYLELELSQEILAGLSKTHELPIALCEWIDMRREYGAFIA
jgi:hypothetical protein